jgi:hypothetical protein
MMEVDVSYCDDANLKKRDIYLNAVSLREAIDDKYIYRIKAWKHDVFRFLIPPEPSYIPITSRGLKDVHIPVFSCDFPMSGNTGGKFVLQVMTKAGYFRDYKRNHTTESTYLCPFPAKPIKVVTNEPIREMLPLALWTPSANSGKRDLYVEKVIFTEPIDDKYAWRIRVTTHSSPHETDIFFPVTPKGIEKPVFICSRFGASCQNIDFILQVRSNGDGDAEFEDYNTKHRIALEYRDQIYLESIKKGGEFTPDDLNFLIREKKFELIYWMIKQDPLMAEQMKIDLWYACDMSYAERHDWPNARERDIFIPGIEEIVSAYMRR